MDLYIWGEPAFVGLVNESVHGHERTQKGTMLLVGFLAVSSAGGIAGATIPINGRDYLDKESEKRGKEG